MDEGKRPTEDPLKRLPVTEEMHHGRTAYLVTAEPVGDGWVGSWVCKACEAKGRTTLSLPTFTAAIGMAKNYLDIHHLKTHFGDS